VSVVLISTSSNPSDDPKSSKDTHETEGCDKQDEC
jgi:hypothetical protein